MLFILWCVFRMLWSRRMEKGSRSSRTCLTDTESKTSCDEPGCLCNINLPVSDAESLLDVRDLCSDISLDEDLLLEYGLNLECDDDRMYTFPQDVLDELHKLKSNKNAIPTDLLKLLSCTRKEETDDRFACGICKKTFSRLSLVMDHKYRVHNISDQFKCKMCTYSCNMFRNLTCHVYRQHRNKTVEEKDSKKKMKADGENGDAVKKKRQYKKRTFKNDFKCSKCDRVFKQEQNLKRHEASHARVFKCSWQDCQKTFRDNYNLQCHIQTHTKQKERACPLCDFVCIQKASLLWHTKKKHPVN